MHMHAAHHAQARARARTHVLTHSETPRHAHTRAHATRAHTDGSDAAHMQEWVTAAALTFLDRANAASKPFFLYMNPTAPHAPDANVSLNTFAATATPSVTRVCEGVCVCVSVCVSVYRLC
jgi:hypothetical protein